MGQGTFISTLTPGGLFQLAKTISLAFRADSRFENILSNGKSRMTLVSLDAGDAVDTNRTLISIQYRANLMLKTLFLRVIKTRNKNS